MDLSKKFEVPPQSIAKRCSCQKKPLAPRAAAQSSASFHVLESELDPVLDVAVFTCAPGFT